MERSKNDINKTACYTYVEKNMIRLLEEENLETKLKLAYQIWVIILLVELIILLIPSLLVKFSSISVMIYNIR